MPVEEVGKTYHVSVDGQGYVLYVGDAVEGGGYRRVTVPLDAAAQRTSNNQVLLDRYLVQRWDDFSGGTGQANANRADSDPTKHRDGFAIDPFTKAPSIRNSADWVETNTGGTAMSTSSTNVMAVSSGYNSETWATDCTDGIWAIPAVTSSTPTKYTPNASDVILKLTAKDGAGWCLFEDNGGGDNYVETFTSPASMTTWASAWKTSVGSGTYITDLDWIGDRMAGFFWDGTDLKWTTWDIDGVEEVTAGDGRLTLPDTGGADWGTVTNTVYGDGYAYFAQLIGHSIQIYSWEIGSADAPVVAATITSGWQPDLSGGTDRATMPLLYHQGALYLSANSLVGDVASWGLWVGVPSGNGGLTLSLATEQTANYYPVNYNMIGLNRQIFIGGVAGIGVYDSSTGGYERYGGDYGGALCPAFPLGSVQAVSSGYAGTDAGYFRFNNPTTFNDAAYWESSYVDLGSNLNKAWDELTVVTDNLLSTGLFRVRITIDADAATQTLLTQTSTGQVHTWSLADIDALRAGRICSIRLEWLSTSEVVVQSVELRCHQLDVSDEVIVLPIDCRPKVTGYNGREIDQGPSPTTLATLRALVNTRVEFQDVDYGDTSSVEDVEVVSVDVQGIKPLHDQHTNSVEPGYVALVTLRKVGT